MLIEVSTVVVLRLGIEVVSISVKLPKVPTPPLVDADNV